MTIYRPNDPHSNVLFIFYTSTTRYLQQNVSCVSDVKLFRCLIKSDNVHDIRFQNLTVQRRVKFASALECWVEDHIEYFIRHVYSYFITNIKLMKLVVSTCEYTCALFCDLYVCKTANFEKNCYDLFFQFC